MYELTISNNAIVLNKLFRIFNVIENNDYIGYFIENKINMNIKFKDYKNHIISNIKLTEKRTNTMLKDEFQETERITLVFDNEEEMFYFKMKYC